MPNLYFLISGFFCSILIVILFFTKERVKTKETKIYGFMILSSLIDIILVMVELLICYFNYTEFTKMIVHILNKIDLIHYILWVNLLLLYIYFISFGGTKKYDKLKTYTLSLDILFILIEFLLPLNIINTDGTMGITGAAPTFVYLVALIYLIVIILIMIKNIKKIFTKKYIPLTVLIAFMIVAAFVRAVNPTLIIIPSIIAYINLIMFNTIENPDVKMIEELNMARDRADKANQAKTEFLSNMSHEIRTPLNAIVGFSNSLIEDSNDKEKITEDAKYIVKASQNLLELVNGILDISKIEAGKIEIINTEYEISEVLDNLIALSKARLGEKPIEFRTSFDESLPKYLYGDASRLKQICINLLTNSIKYTKEGFIEFKVSSVIKDDICRLIISVEDSGIGIKNEDIDKLFEKFGRLDLEKNISIEGSGLGLAITKKLVNMMNGKIVVQSEYGIGSKFTISIDQKITKGNLNKNDHKEQIEVLEFPNKKILIIDDNKLNLKVAEKVLQPFKVIITTASSGDEGIEKIINENFDLVLLDDMMPGKTGTDTLKELKENLADYKTPTVALTANAIVGMKEKYLAAGFDDYIAKPIEKEELKRILNKYLK